MFFLSEAVQVQQENISNRTDSEATIFKGIYEFNLAFQLRLPGKSQDTQKNVDCT